MHKGGLLRSAIKLLQVLLGVSILLQGVSFAGCREDAPVLEQTAPEKEMPEIKERNSHPETELPKDVLSGIDVLCAEGAKFLEHKRCGLITNKSAVTRGGQSTIEALVELENVNLVALFGPEHGLEGTYQSVEVPDGTDTTSELPVYSLYGSTRKPTPEQLSTIDTLLFDIQDVGMRFYTYISTLSLSMEAAGNAGVHFVVLDRPNPIGGKVVEGPVLQEDFSSFVGCHPIAIRHGMTVGELAGMFNAQFLDTPTDLRVVRMQGWKRDQWYDETGLPWRKPSPGIYTMDTAVAYGATCFLEGTNMSEGRGTDTPFEIVGAPWVDGRKLAGRLNALDLPGIRFHAQNFVPLYNKHEDRCCGGVRLEITDRDAYRCILAGVAILTESHRLWPDKLGWRSGNFIDLLAGTDDLRLQVDAGKEAREIVEGWEAETNNFLGLRKQYILYR